MLKINVTNLRRFFEIVNACESSVQLIVAEREPEDLRVCAHRLEVARCMPLTALHLHGDIRIHWENMPGSEVQYSQLRPTPSSMVRTS